MHDHSHAQNRYAVIPTPEKLGADPGISGHGVTIAFLDSGFTAHPDIASRVEAFHDVTGAETWSELASEAESHHWHGTQTVVSCAGDGSLSDGVYRGFAPSARLVLVKVSDRGRITDASIEAGLRWISANRNRYDIRVLNMSLGGDVDLPEVDSRINQLAEQLVDDGVVITVAAGNSSEQRSVPPGSSRSVITVGGYSDENQFEESSYDLYHSSHGTTIDGLVKPELIAPAMYVAAPILPQTKDYNIAEALSVLEAAPDYSFRRLLRETYRNAGLTEEVLELDDRTVRGIVARSLRERKIVATHYQHVDGTSFAAPIVASIVAQMLEVNPALTPASVKNILVSTASRLTRHPHVRQGFGIVCAQRAVNAARKETHRLKSTDLHPPRVEKDRIVFSFHEDAAVSVALCGDFNGWEPDRDPMSRRNDGLWTIEMPCVPPGTYRYKFLVDNSKWTEDPSHGHKEDDGHGGFDSLLTLV